MPYPFEAPCNGDDLAFTMFVLDSMGEFDEESETLYSNDENEDED